jgi:acetyl-CoA carboxylase carboxyl transferase subunit alpha
MPQPNGYRKAMRFMRHANKFGLPIVTFVDTPGAYAGRTAEELGQVRRLGGSLEGSIGFRQRVRGSQKQQVGSRP